MDTFIAECDDFTKKFGDRFTVPDSLRAMAKAGKSIHDFGKSDLSVADVKKLKEVELVALANKMGISATVDDLKADTLKKVLAKMEA
jgi:hypothetical protein